MLGGPAGELAAQHSPRAWPPGALPSPFAVLEQDTGQYLTSPGASSCLLLPQARGRSGCRLLKLCLLAEPCPSTLLQRHMADLLRSDRDLAPSFLNSVLNQLNWAFSEFIGMIQEVSVSAPEACPCPAPSGVQGSTLRAGSAAVPWHTREPSWRGGCGPSFGKRRLGELSVLLGRSSRQRSAWRETLWTAAS